VPTAADEMFCTVQYHDSIRNLPMDLRLVAVRLAFTGIQSASLGLTNCKSTEPLAAVQLEGLISDRREQY